MIYDTIENLAQYAPLLPGLEKAAAFLARKDLAQLPDGRVEIDGDRVFANLQTYDTKAIDMRGFEANRAYADVQPSRRTSRTSSRPTTGRRTSSSARRPSASGSA